jgi:Ca-activated chloride channel family protein
MARLVFLALVLAVSWSTSVASEAVEIVLDASGAMSRPCVGGLPIHVNVREAVAAVTAEAPALRPELALGLRLAGGDPDRTGVESCSATSLVVPVAKVDGPALRWQLDGVNPRGLRPLIASVLSAFDDLEGGPKDRRVVVVTSGDDQCGRSLQEVAAALAARDRPAELRIVGLGLDPTTVDRYGAVPIRNATSAEELLAALRWAVLDADGDAPRATGAVLLHLAADGEPSPAARVVLDDLATGQTRSDTVDAEARFDLPAGRYRVTVGPEGKGFDEYRDLVVVAGVDAHVELDLNPLPPTAFEVLPEVPMAGDQVWVRVVGPAPEGARLVFAADGGPALSAEWSPHEEGTWVSAPRPPSATELLLVGPAAAGARRVLARRQVGVIAPVTTLGAPEEVAVGKPITVDVKGSVASGDSIALTPRGGGVTDVFACVGIASASESRIAAPTSEGEYDLIFVVGATAEVAARTPLLVTGPAAAVTAPDTVTAGERFEVAWEGPEHDEDFVSLSRVGSPDDEYLQWSRVETGSPAAFDAPALPGTYEIRYVDGETGKARARAALEVAAVAVDLRAPDAATAGLRFEVGWTGPATTGDFVAIARPGAPPHRFLDWASTTVGSPITLAAPTKPGSYEVRYVAGGGREILARIPIEVRR